MNKKKLITVGLVTLVVAALGTMIWKTMTMLEKKKLIKEQLKSMSSIPLLNLDSIPYQFDNEGKATLLVYFNSTCEHCQSEIKEIKSRINDFNLNNVLLVSSESIQAISLFANQFELNDIRNVRFAKINEDKVFDTFGSVSFPYIMVYDKNNQLHQDFKGEVRIETLIKFCNTEGQ